MTRSILGLHEVRAHDAAFAGGKAANLGELLGKGFPVPAGFVVSSSAYVRFLERLDMEGELRGMGDAPRSELPQRCASVRARIEATDLPPALSAEILAAHARLTGTRGPDVLCAVRSSATAEDLGAASFAGQHSTYYYVDAPHLLPMIRKCWASLWSPEAVSYRATHGIDGASVHMAVVVQEMIPSDISGVAFTANPVTGVRSELIIESSWGMGAAIVDGRVTPDRYIVEREGLRLRERRISDKRFMVASHLETGRDARLSEVPHAMRRRETLSAEQVQTVAEWSLRSEAHFGKPQDVEWAISQGRFHMLQSRPITVMGREEVGLGVKGKYVLFKPIVENFTDPLTPFSTDMLLMVRPPGLRFIRGWIYVDVEFLRRLLPFAVSDEDLARHAYSFSREPPALRFSPGKALALLPLGLLAYLVSAVLLARSAALPDDAMDGYRALCLEVDGDPGLGPEAAMRRLLLLPDLLDPIGNMAVMVNAAAVRFAPWMGVLRLLVRRWAGDLRPDAEALLGSGSEGVLSAEMGRGIWALAQEARRSERVREVLLGPAPERALPALKEVPEARPFLDRLDRFLAKNGHRAVKEFELRSVRWEEDPAPVLGMVRNYLSIDAGPEVQERKAAEARDHLFRELRERLDAWPLERLLGFRFRLIHFVAERVRYYFKLRENSRFFHIMGFGVVRKKVLRIEQELMAQGKLKCKDDIFFLRSAEVARMQTGHLAWRDVEDRIRERRIEHIRLCKMGPPKTLGFAPLPPPPPGTTLGDAVLSGQCASPGRYEGVARVILDPSIDAQLEPGEVLVAPYTDPAWTPLFLTAGAAVVEIGSYLSHAGTVAREFGMPCVVDVAEATQRIRTGDRIAIDADLGSVRILGRDQGAPS